MPTRFFLPSTGAAAVTPALGAWDETANAGAALECVTTRISSAMASVTVAKGTGATRALARQYVSKPIDAQTISAGTVKGQVRALESAINDNLDLVPIRITVVSNDGTTLRGTILALGDYVTVLEFGTALTNRKIADGDATTSVTAQAGDRIVIELGIKNSTSGTSVSGSLSFGDDNATDLGENTTDTSAFNPWVELSNTITFQTPAPVPEEESDGWWGAVGMKAANFALAAALALSGTAVRIQSQINNQGDDFVPQAAAAPSVAGTPSPYFQQGMGGSRVVYLFGGEDFVPQQATPFVSDEDENAYQPTRTRTSSVPRVFYDTEVLPTGAAAPPSVSDQSSPAFTVGGSRARIVYLYGDDVLPQQVVPDDDGLVWVVIPERKTVRPIAVEDDLPQQVAGPSLSVDEYEYQPPVRKIARLVLPVTDADDFAPQVVVPSIVYEEDQWPISLKRPTAQIIQPFAYEDVLPGGIAPPVVGGFTMRITGGPVLVGPISGGPVLTGTLSGGPV